MNLILSVLDLKDQFFSLPLAEVSQLIFVSEWTDPEAGYNGQLTWTRLPKDLKNFPTLFKEALSAADCLPFQGHMQMTSS